ncbi:MAG: UvrD-helicase domain-containing protein [Armatimonadetes bacterium]|nr:UvrD-helicase domain-containing protein [Armatimonadota bacterium]MDE2206514.1 UvrD-helicase domain-containing protein [Armatimonadota bacterium]
MNDWAAARRDAVTWRRELGLDSAGNPTCIPGAAAVHAALTASGFTVTLLRPDDPLLGGAIAVLDRCAGQIWMRSDLDDERRLFVTAHELGHYRLHPDYSGGESSAVANEEAWGDDLFDEAVGYSPVERNENEANVFAAEFLMPAQVLQHLFYDQGWTATQIAAHLGVGYERLLRRMPHALLLPDVEKSPAVDTQPGSLQLDAEQQRAAWLETGPALVDAGPGTGKTRVLTARITWLMEHQHIQPHEILALTFTNRAANEMRTRITRGTGAKGERVWIGTFHSFALDLLRKEGAGVGVAARPAIADTVDAVAMLLAERDRLQLRTSSGEPASARWLAGGLQAISRACNALKSPDSITAAAIGRSDVAEVTRLWSALTTLMEERSMLFLGELVARAVHLLQKEPAVLRRQQAMYHHLLVDEYQDVNQASAEMVRLMAGGGSGLWVVGDARQTICRWNGSDPHTVSNFRAAWPNASVVSLRANYRAAPPLVRLVSGVASHEALPGLRGMGFSIDAATQQSGDLWNAVRQEAPGNEITIVRAEDDEAEADFVAEQCSSSHRKGRPWRDHAVLCRTHAQAASMADRLRRRDVPVLAMGMMWQRPEVRDMIALLKAGGGDTLASRRLSTIPALSSEAGRIADDPFTANATAEEPGDTSSAWSLLAGSLFERTDYLRSAGIADNAEAACHRLSIYGVLQRAWRPAAASTRQHRLMTPCELGDRLLLEIECHANRASAPPPGLYEMDAVSLLTIHSSKGLEFPVVFLPQLAGEHFEWQAGADIDSDDAEDTSNEASLDAESLFFVGLSRARDSLFLSWGELSDGRPCQPVRFLQAITGAAPAQSRRRVNSRNEPPTGRPVLQGCSLSKVTDFQWCPRLTLYREAGDTVGDTTNLVLFRFVQTAVEAVGGACAGRAAANVPDVAEQAMKQFAADAAPEERADLQRLLPRALGFCAAIADACASRHVDPRPRGLVLSTRWGEIRSKPNLVCSERGDLVFERLVWRSLRASDARDERCLIWSASLRQKAKRPPRVFVRSLTTRDVTEVQNTRQNEDLCVRTAEGTLREMASKQYRPAPAEYKCSVCPMFLLCPHN